MSLALVTCAPSFALADEPPPVRTVVAGSGCPDQARLDEALRGRGMAVVDGAPFLLNLHHAPDGVRVELLEVGAEALLERTLPAGECLAIAETVALLVERRLAGVGWQAPFDPAAPRAPGPRVASRTTPVPRVTAAAPAPAPDRPWSLDLFAGGEFATGFRQGAGATGPTVDLRLRPPWPFGVRLTVGWLIHPDRPLSAGRVEIQRVPIALAGGWSLRRSGLELDLEAVLMAEVISTETFEIAQPASTTRVAIRAGPAASFGVEVIPRLWLLAHAAAYGVIAGYDYYLHSVSDPTRRTPLASQVAALEVGAAVGWRFGPR